MTSSSHPATHAAPPTKTVQPWWRRLATRLALNAGIGAVLTGLQGGTGLMVNMLYSLAIGMSCAAFIGIGRRVAARWKWRHQPDTEQARRGWPGWPLMAVVLAVATVLGYTLGAWIGNAVLGQRLLPMPWGMGATGAIGTLTISLTVAVIASNIYSARARLAIAQSQVEAAQRQAAQTQLKLLESQLEPHMLFNTLANLRALITLDPPRATAMLDHLIAFLRSTLAASRAAMHPLAAEFDRTADYLALMQVRLGDRLTTTLDLPPALAAHPVPPLLLQPLVENAIQHGIEPNRGGGRIALVARHKGDRLVLSVRDTGVGLAHAALSAAAAQPGSGFGTTQVRERLATLYGSAAALRIEPAPDGGVLATITLPWSLA